MDKAKIQNKTVFLPLNIPQGSVRISDKNGNHMEKPTKIKNDPHYYVEWMIKNEDNKNLADEFLSNAEKIDFAKKLEKISKFVGDSKYTKRESVKITSEKIEDFLEFGIYKYTENFYSFEKEIASKIKVRITFKLGNFGLMPHPHMYVLLPFNHNSVKIKNIDGDVKIGKELGKKCLCEWIPTKSDVEDIILVLAHASEDHRNDLIQILKS